MKSGSNIFIKAGNLAFELLLCHMLVAQPEPGLLFFRQDFNRLMKLNLYNNLPVIPSLNPEAAFQSASFPPRFSSLLPTLPLSKEADKPISFSQYKTSTDMPQLGSVEHYSNHFRWDAGSKTEMDIGAGMAMQNTIMNLFAPNYQFTFKGSAGYAYNDWITVYLYGQYLTAPLNKPDHYFDPFMHFNPLFLQNEVGAGMYTTYKKSRIDLQIFSIYGSDFKDAKPVYSKLRIGF